MKEEHGDGVCPIQEVHELKSEMRESARYMFQDYSKNTSSE